MRLKKLIIEGKKNGGLDILEIEELMMQEKIDKSKMSIIKDTSNSQSRN